MKTILFLAGPYTNLVEHLKIGTPNIVLISSDFLSEADKEDQRMRFKLDPDGAISRAKLKKFSDHTRDPKIELIIIDRAAVGPSDLKKYEERAMEYTLDCKVTNMEVTSNSSIEEKDLVFISGSTMLEFAELVTKNNPAAMIISDTSANISIDKFLTAMNNSSLKLLVMNSTNFFGDGDLLKPLRQFSAVRGYGFQCVKIIPSAEELAQTQNEEEVSKLEDENLNTNTNYEVKDLGRKPSWYERNIKPWL